GRPALPRHQAGGRGAGRAGWRPRGPPPASAWSSPPRSAGCAPPAWRTHPPAPDATSDCGLAVPSDSPAERGYEGVHVVRLLPALSPAPEQVLHVAVEILAAVPARRHRGAHVVDAARPLVAIHAVQCVEQPQRRGEVQVEDLVQRRVQFAAQHDDQFSPVVALAVAIRIASDITSLRANTCARMVFIHEETCPALA